eukprot:TRINITY_DN22865_c0_g1_i1.p1 TRINITY_DN22865_c0_g1~~TRINITY_DN22865_c0_g1_i1.p1  ORF type:complete len:280 (+),score=23.03 TRINITY_DN22865_c0_g1_i1:44-841(+)
MRKVHISLFSTYILLEEDGGLKRSKSGPRYLWKEEIPLALVKTLESGLVSNTEHRRALSNARPPAVVECKLHKMNALTMYRNDGDTTTIYCKTKPSQAYRLHQLLHIRIQDIVSIHKIDPCFEYGFCVHIRSGYTVLNRTPAFLYLTHQQLLAYKSPGMIPFFTVNLRMCAVTLERKKVKVMTTFQKRIRIGLNTEQLAVAWFTDINKVIKGITEQSQNGGRSNESSLESKSKSKSKSHTIKIKGVPVVSEQFIPYRAVWNFSVT